MASHIPVSDWGDLPHELLMRILNPSQPEDPFAACAAACVCRHWRHTENNRHIADASIQISVPRARDPYSQLWWLRSHANVKSVNISATGSWYSSSRWQNNVQEDDRRDIAAELLSAVPIACEALSIGKFVAQILANPSPLLYLPQLKTLLLHCRQDFVERSIRMVREQAADLYALTELVIESPFRVRNLLMPEKSLSELLEAVSHLPDLRALSARSFHCNNLEGILDAAPQLRELRLRDGIIWKLTPQEFDAMDALKARLEVLDLHNTMDHPSLEMVSRFYDFSMGMNLRVLNLSSTGRTGGRRMPSPFLLPPNLAELDLTGAIELNAGMVTMAISGAISYGAHDMQDFPLLSIAFVEVWDMPILRSELQNLASGLTWLELLPTTTSQWEILPRLTKLRSLASGCGRGGPQLHSSLSKLTNLQLALRADIKSDLSCLTQLKELFLGGECGAVFTGQLPSSLSLLTLDDALTRYRYRHGAKAARDIIEAQSDMLRPLKQLRRLVWVENCPGRRITLPWPEMPTNLEELELTSGSGANWEVLLPMRSLRRLKVLEDARGSSHLQEILTLMPQLHTVVHHKACTGEGFHRKLEYRYNNY